MSSGTSQQNRGGLPISLDPKPPVPVPMKKEMNINTSKLFKPTQDVS